MAANAREESLPVDVGDEPLVGWRCWHVLPHEGLLRPIFKRGLVWKPRQALEALCPEQPHEVPADNCQCGVWTVCHPMLLDEVGWANVPPTGIRKLPGVMVVGEVSLWGKIIQHERGWRASFAYPRHLYVFTDDPMIAETLRERYGVPVEWGADVERLRRMLPLQDAKDGDPEEQSALRETLLDVLRTGLCPKELEELAATAIDAWPDVLEAPETRIEKARAELARAATAKERTDPGWHLLLAAADVRVLQGDARAARRALWVRLARWQLWRGDDLLEKTIEPCLRQRVALLEDLARGTDPRPGHGGRPYSATTLDVKRRELEKHERQIAECVPKIEALLAVPIPTYREWCAIARGVVLGSRARPPEPSEELRRDWHRRAMQREQRLAKLDRELALQRHQLNVDRAALEERQLAVAEGLEELARERAKLRDDVVAGVQRDHADLLREVGELESRRRAALAMLPGPWPPALRRSVKVAAVRSVTVAPGHPALAARLRELGIIQARVAELAGCSRSKVNFVLAGRIGARSRSRESVLQAAQALIKRAEEERHEDSTASVMSDAAERPTPAISPPPRSGPIRDELVREREELDALQRQVASERTKVDVEKTALEHARRQLELDARKNLQATTDQLARHVAAGLRPRLQKAGISLTMVAKAARVSLSTVSHALSGHFVSVAAVAAAEQLLAEAEK